GMIDVLVGVNLLREGLDLPEVSLVVILDADQEGFLRNVRSLTQISGRAARHVNGEAIFYAHRITGSIRQTVEESNRRRDKQVQFNFANELLPRSASRSGSGQSSLIANHSTKDIDLTARRLTEEHYTVAADVDAPYEASPVEEAIDVLIARAKEAMEKAAKELDFIAAAEHRDRMYALQAMRDEQLKR
ncbi:MAG: UvrB/UvrC motif-containing protein, partial [Alistipes sp.]|nr:UvrB/UvrC motif-containing protein [Alistipes sp.]